MESKKIDIPLILNNLIPLESFHVAPVFRPYLDGICYSDGTLSSRTEKLAWDIAEFYKDERYTMLTMMKGAIHFSSILTKFLASIYSSGVYKNTIRNEFIKVKSYLNDKSTGQVNIFGLEHCSIEGKNILIVEDIVDSGLSMEKLIETLSKHNPKSIKICSMIKRKKTYNFDIDFVGIDSEGRDYFFVGFGLDYNEFFRDLTHLAVLNDHGKKSLEHHE